ncbi:MAG: ABC transporter permease [Acidobacteria bacterium]|nr:ABC transporter permease [Acidobacteriota bacterium]
MVSARWRLSSLNRKLLRDLWAMWGQALAIGLVVAAGVAMYVAYLSNFESLERTRDSYYAEQRFADVFGAVHRAPDRLRDRMQALPGVTEIETRVVADVVIDVPGLDEPATGRLISIPTSGQPALNRLYLRGGRWISPGHADEVIASEAFVLAHGFHPGDRVGAVINGRRRELTIVGLALSPEYVYSIRPGDIVPDARRFGVFWMSREALAAAFQMEASFNDVLLRLSKDSVPQEVVAGLDRLLEPYGARGAVLRATQMSNWALENELNQLRSFGFFVPFVFLLVAAFVLDIALTRALSLQRPVLAALKALGFTNRELAWHYLKWAMAIAGAGGAAGVALGAWMGSAMIGLYNLYFKFPELAFGLSPSVVLTAVGIALASALVGAITAVRRAVRIPPAEAMRPEQPARFRHSELERLWGFAGAGTAMRMIVRNLTRHPTRALTTIVGIGFAAAILQVGFSLTDAMDALMTTQFSVAERQHTAVTFTEPVSAEAVHALTRLPGVLDVEPVRIVPARLRSGPRVRTLAITGLPAAPDLRRPLDRDEHVVEPAPGGLVLSAVLARVLDVTPGDRVTVEVLEGRQPTYELPVARLVDDIFGISAYMEIGELHRLIGEDALLSGASMLVDTAREADLSGAFKALPAVAGVAWKHVVLDNFRKAMAENMGVMLTFNIGFACVIAFGVVYNAARVSLSERSRELASLRVLGFTRAEISAILLGELAILTVAALPAGALIGHGLTTWLVSTFESEIYRFPVTLSARVVAWSSLTVIAASLVSALLVRRRLDRLDLIGVLKLRE